MRPAEGGALRATLTPALHAHNRHSERSKICKKVVLFTTLAVIGVRDWRLLIEGDQQAARRTGAFSVV